MEHYSFVVRETEIEDIINGEIKRTRTVVLGLLDKKRGIVLPHPLTDFIRLKYEYQSKSLNAQLAAARTISRFLNFIYGEIIKQDEEFLNLVYLGIKGLKLIHGSRYITHLSSRGIKKETVENYEGYLKVFFLFLQEQKLVDLEFNLARYLDIEGKWIEQSPFKHSMFQTKYPRRETQVKRRAKLKDFGENRYILTLEFIQKTREIAPEIAFGVCLQFYGGLRRGEVVNLTRGSIKAKFGESMNVEIRDNRRILFQHLKDTSKENPKRLNYLQVHMANQTVLDNELLWEVFDDHLRTLDIMGKRNRLLDYSALFVDQDGKAMSGNVYERKFKKVKKYFMKELGVIEGRDDDFELLNESYWGTHIGRGNFTNFLFDMGLTITQIAIARGDTSIDSAMEYVDEKVTQQAIKEAIEELKNTPVEKIGDIDRGNIDKYWKDGVLNREREFGYGKSYRNRS